RCSATLTARTIADPSAIRADPSLSSSSIAAKTSVTIALPIAAPYARLRRLPRPVPALESCSGKGRLRPARGHELAYRRRDLFLRTTHGVAKRRLSHGDAFDPHDVDVLDADEREHA